METCIYCLEQKARNQFSTEHVLPKALGGFKQALTLSRSTKPYVCAMCNQLFGETIDRLLTREGHEGFLRLKHALKSVHEIADLFQDGDIYFNYPAYHPLGPLHAGLRAPPPGIAVPGLFLRPQVRLGRSGSFACLLEKDFDGLKDLPSDYDVETIAFFCTDPVDFRRLKAKLDARGLAKNWTPIPDLPSGGLGETTLEVIGSVGPESARAIAKIAFNYLAYTAGRKLVLHPHFNPIREFIRCGRGIWGKYVQCRVEPTEDGGPSEREGHVLGVRWADGDRDVHAIVSLFSVLTYEVRLCTNFSGVWREVGSGHHFDLATCEITPLRLSPRPRLTAE
ncbi:MAG: hypothetical protein IH968_01045 [Gemmatimonadetes bacterium]|nr:hypothetical protein [Gemmatimonadota bacterium]